MKRATTKRLEGTMTASNRGTTHLRVLASAALVLSLAAAAGSDDFADYGSAGSTTVEMSLPSITRGFSAAADQFPAGTPTSIGGFSLEGRTLVAVDRSLYLQNNLGSEGFVEVATVDFDMDPSFVKISPSGDRIALGLGFGQPLLVFPTEILDPDGAPGLDAHPETRSYLALFLDAAWHPDDRHLLLTGGLWPGPPFGAGVGVVDTDTSAAGRLLIGEVPGASGGVAVDPGDADAGVPAKLVVGVGYANSSGRTGEIRAFPLDDVTAAISGGTLLSFETTGALVADNVLSGSQLHFDTEHNLVVGGGDSQGAGGAPELGYAALLHASVVDGVLLGGGGPVDESDSQQYRELSPDPCGDDSFTGATFNAWGGGIGVIWNPSSLGSCGGAGGNLWGPGITPRMTVYYPASAPDTDLDGVPDAADNAYLTPNPDQTDADGDGFGNASDGDFNQDQLVGGPDFNVFLGCFLQASGSAGPPDDADCSETDMNGDGLVGGPDFDLFLRGFNRPPGPVQ